MLFFGRDAAHGLRLLTRHRSFTAAALITLALCTGVNTAMFSVVNALLIRPLPYEDAERLVHIYNAYPRAGVERGGASVPDYYDRQDLPALAAVAMMQERGMTIGESGRPERVQGRAVTPSFFTMLGVQPVLGRTFLEEEGEPGANRQAVLSWQLWQDRYGGSPDVLGRSVRIDDVEHTVVGVMPRRFVFESAEDRLWVPLAFPLERRGDDARHNNNWGMIGKLRAGVTVAQAQQQIDALNARNEERVPQFAELLRQVGFHTVVVDYRSDLIRDVRSTLWLLQAGVLLVLLIGCVNIANLILVRSTARHREMATRAALGGRKTRLAGQLLTESLVLALAGGALGLLVGWGSVRAVASFAAERLPRGTEIGFDATAMLAALLISILAGLVFGAIPVARLMRADLSSVFRDEGRSGTASRATQAWRGALVVAQVSLAFALLVGAGLMIVSFARTLSVQPGFSAENVLTASVSLPVTRYQDAAMRRQFARSVLEEVRSLPGVTDAAVTSVLPFGGDFNANAVTPEGYEPQPGDALLAPTIVSVSDGYFETMSIRMSQGRTFQAADGDGALDVAIIDRLLAEKFWPGQDPIGKRIAQGVPQNADEARFFTIVGVAEPARTRKLTEPDPVGNLYIPAAQQPPGQLFLVVKTSIQPTAVTGGVRTALANLDPDLPLYDVRTMEDRLARSVATERFRMILLTGFGALALFLAAVGLYGVLAYAVAQRAPEIGIRMALGSSDGAIFRMVVQQGARLLGLGLVIGAAASLALGRFVQSMLYGVTATDPAVILGVFGMLSVAALAACVLPAWRATRVDPLVAIRSAN